MPDADVVAIAFTADASQLSAGSNQAARTVADATREMTGAHERHIGSLRALKSEMAGSMRTANFFARSLNDIVPATGLAGEGLRLVISGLAGGAGLGLAIEAAMVGLRALGEHFQEEAKHAEEFSKKLREIADIGDKAEKAMRKIQLLKRGFPEHLAEAISSEDTAKLDEAELDANIKKREAQRKLDDAISRNRSMQYVMEREGIQGLIRVYPHLTEFTKELTKADEQLAEVSKARSAVTATANAEDAKTAKQHHDSTTLKLIALDAERKLAEGASEVHRLEIQRDRALAEIEQRRKTAKAEELADLDREKKALIALYAEKIRVAQIDEAARANAVYEDPEAERDIRVSEDRQKMREEESKSYTAAKKKMAEASEHFAASASRELTAVITGEKTLKDMVQETGRMILQSLLQAAIKKITMSAMVAAAGAAESQAAIPVVGPALAAEQSASMMAMVLGLLGSLPSYAKGSYYIPHDQVAYLHKGEEVRTEQEVAFGSGRGRGGPSITVVATDTQDFARAALDSGSDLSEALRQLRRANRGAW